jgi:hypothetical protein
LGTSEHRPLRHQLSLSELRPLVAITVGFRGHSLPSQHFELTAAVLEPTIVERWICPFENVDEHFVDIRVFDCAARKTEVVLVLLVDRHTNDLEVQLIAIGALGLDGEDWWEYVDFFAVRNPLWLRLTTT